MCTYELTQYLAYPCQQSKSEWKMGEKLDMSVALDFRKSPVFVANNVATIKCTFLRILPQYGIQEPENWKQTKF